MQTMAVVTVLLAVARSRLPPRHQRCITMHMPALPPAGADGDDASSQPEMQPYIALRRSMRLAFTCKVCDTRNEKLINRHCYKEGIVIVRCTGCDSNHLIADNLSWVHPGFGSLEEWAERQEDRVVTRITDADGVQATWIFEANDAEDSQ